MLARIPIGIFGTDFDRASISSHNKSRMTLAACQAQFRVLTPPRETSPLIYVKGVSSLHHRRGMKRVLRNVVVKILNRQRAKEKRE
ncbi:hypothetical protein MES5069_450045 [Mesorhizobium escarrei]|uniref:IS110 family transposase n=1 Tax=Mesorhizobium escarrei TaxID=666018 RepID=A0ABM9E7G2_9HYPH|nr:hypothetical protein MES5069_450045 [Mesorhizobium escarrei]